MNKCASIIRFTCSLCFLVTSFTISAVSPSPQKDWKKMVMDDIDFVHHAYETSYAPVNWKRNYMDVDFNQSVLEAKTKIMDMSQPSPWKIRQILKQLLSSLKDYHVGIYFHSTELAILPFEVREAQGRYFIVAVYSSKLPFAVGDELLSFGGRPVDEVVTELQNTTDENHDLTDKALTTMRLTVRLGMMGDKVPKGDVTLIWRKNGTKVKDSTTLSWEYYAEEVPWFAQGDTAEKPKPKMDISMLGKKDEIKVAEKPKGVHDFTVLQEALFPKSRKAYIKCDIDLDDESDDSDEEDEDDSDDFPENPHNIGSYRGFIPPLGEVLWESGDDRDDCFYAYTFALPNGKVGGFVRLPTYHVGGWFGSDYPEYADSFHKLMTKLDKGTDVLVIDQTNNGGGSLAYLYALLKSLAKEPLKVPAHRVLLTYDDISSAVDHISFPFYIEWELESQGYPVTEETIWKYLEYEYDILQEWNDSHRLTKPIAIYGIDVIEPYSDSYKKPVLLLINQLDFSGGDFFPAILQDNKRVKTFGTRTAGAGGYISQHSFSNLSGIYAFSLTGSIAERDGEEKPIENLGVTPDVKYVVTPADYEFGFQGYKKKVVSTLTDMLKEETPRRSQKKGRSKTHLLTMSGNCVILLRDYTIPMRFYAHNNHAFLLSSSKSSFRRLRVS